MSLDAYIHVSKPPAPYAPLVFAFHGTGGNEHQFVGFIEDILPGAGIVSPLGDVAEQGKNRFFRQIADGVHDMEDLAFRTGRMMGFVIAHRAANARSPVYALGYSNGANILAAVLFAAPGLFSRAVLLHPLIPWTPASDPRLAKTEVLVTAGQLDPTCPLPCTLGLVEHLRGQDAHVALHLHGGGHEMRPEELAATATFLRRPAS